MTPKQYEYLREQHALKIAREEPAEEARRESYGLCRSNAERRRASNRKYCESDRGKVGLEIRGIRLVIRTTERRIERDRDRLANLQGLLADREKQLDAIPRKRRLNQLGFVGVTARSSRRFMAMLHLFGRKYYCGIHETPEQAAAAIEAKRAELKREKT